MKKLLSSTIAIGILAVTSAAPAFALAENAMPQFNHGSGMDIESKTATDMNVKNTTGTVGGVAEGYWDSFNVGKNGHVNFEFSNYNQTTVNHVNAAGGISNIYGSITKSSNCPGCDFAGSSKVFLLNPNGVLFGDTANVNLNSLTVAASDGTWDAAKKQLVLNNPSGDIKVLEGAEIYGDKAINFFAKNVDVYKGSKLTTNVNKNFNMPYGDNADSMSKVKIVTADGVTFQFYDQGAVDEITAFKTSNDQMHIGINGEITSGNIDVRNYSKHNDSDLNVNGANLKAVKAQKGNDGNIWLIANNKVIVDNSKLTTVREDGAAAEDANIVIKAGKKVSVGSSDLNAEGDIKISSSNNDIVVDGSKLTAGNDVTLNAGRIASVQNQKRGNSTITGKNVTINGGDVWFSGATVKASGNINAEAKTGNVVSDKAVLETGNNGKITLRAAKDVKGNADVKNSQTNLYAGNDINATLANVGVREKGLVAEAENNVTITTDGTLSVSRLVAKQGDMTINADKVIAGLPYTTEEKIPGDNSERSYIYVANGKFTSNTKSDSYEVTASDTPINDGKDNLRHHIQYGNGQEKILLINPRPAQASTDPVVPATVAQAPNVNDDQAAMLNKMPRQPESIKVNNNITNNKTALVDVFAAASQIEIVEDDEEE